jgi:hypothetical protein
MAATIRGAPRMKFLNIGAALAVSAFLGGCAAGAVVGAVGAVGGAVVNVGSAAVTTTGQIVAGGVSAIGSAAAPATPQPHPQSPH